MTRRRLTVLALLAGVLAGCGPAPDEVTAADAAPPGATPPPSVPPAPAPAEEFSAATVAVLDELGVTAVRRASKAARREAVPVAAASASIARHTHWRLDELVLARVSTSQTAPDLVDRLCWVGIVRDAGYEVPRRLPVPPGSPPRTEAPVPRFVEHFGVFLIDARTGKGLWAANM